MGDAAMAPTHTIAVVNDERNIRQSLRWEFERQGYQVRLFASTADALDLIDNPADLALLDYMNPPLGGIELFRRLRRRHRMPVIFLSAWATEVSEMLAAEGLSAEGYVDQPYTVRGLLSEVRAALASS